MNLKFKISSVIQFYKDKGMRKTIARFINKIFYSSEKKRIAREEVENYKLWIKNNEPTQKELEEQRNYKFEYRPKISVIVPMYNTKEKYLKELIDSLINQTYDNWELCLADGSDEKKEYVKTLVLSDNRIKYKFLNSNNGIAQNSNEALKLSTGEYIALLDHDDILPEFSLYEIVKTINENRDVEFIYTDEDKILEEKENRVGPQFKQDYAPDTLLSYNYICHFSIYKKELIEKIGGFRKEFDGSQDYDLIFRATEQTNKIIHIPKILYHWRINEESVALTPDSKPYAYETAKKAILEHLERINVKAKVEDTKILGIYKVTYEVIGNPKVSIIILNKDHKKDLKRTIKSILKKSTYDNYEIIIVENNSKTKGIFKYYKKLEKNKKIRVIQYKGKEFNYAKLNNDGVNYAQGEYIVLLNNDIKIITNNWIEIMLGNCQRKDVGIVGAKLLYKNLEVQHVGIVLGLTGTIGHANLGLNESEPGYMCKNIISQNCSAVTSAMMMISKADYNEVKGLDENFLLEYSDIDLCLKLINKGKLVVMNSFIEAYHFKSKTKGKKTLLEKENRIKQDENRLKTKWKEFFEKEDPYFNINLRHDTLNIRIRADKVK